ncbi:MAG: glutamate--tRNA ligase [Heliobacteriaceae bacterium]|jgi:glutamyl-tRNA synthetase|nr:glutamate--tRNA ligase [Heliobacteriaceae bacterium]
MYRVRIAPSPSGNLHVGTARTALFNYLFAKKNNGQFILRIEDTDLERSDKEYIKNIFDSLKALGLNWDEGPDVGGDYGPYSQSERFDIYPEFAKKLVEAGFAYECFCTPEELEAEKELSAKNKQAYVYSGKCKNLSDEEKLKRQEEVPAIRFNVSKAQKAFHDSSELSFNDLVKGVLKQDTSLIGDFVIMKSNGTPTYNFAVVVDDMLMKISHIIRGEDHISNTFKQILIYEALGAQAPKFGHLGMILAPDRSKLSKRHGATAVSEFTEKGYLTEALVNFIALLGWSPSDGQEIKSVNEIAEDFRIHDVSSSNSIFEYDKLNWMNSQYIKKLDIETLKNALRPFLAQYDLSGLTDAQYTRMVEITREPLTILSDITNDVPYFFGDTVKVEPEVQAEVLDTETSRKVLREFYNDAQNWEFSEEALHEKLDEFRAKFKEQGIKPKETMWAIRAAVTGRTRGADITAVLAILGREKVLGRVNSELVNSA